ncbi:Hint domain-containing protein [Loktanella sp. IMCC34160]|uniref:Hint domain-containing protein n=1 Tax=Loktanella sp. IMCC34160 TaxID=2510646 RepID=UPI00101B7BDB|nr:Hint domain-containing protein [Loktanella sp. IMCC34160]RYG89224.1 Hint domain-containing protein [Loktanella sp. IMCC34160]
MAAAYISEVYYTGPVVTDFFEVAVPEGTDVSGWTVAIYNSSGGYLLSMSFGTADATMFGHDVYVFDHSTSGFPSLSANISIGLIDENGNTVQFLALYDPPATASNGPLIGETPVWAGVTAASGESVQSTDDGATYAIETVPNAGTIPCFAAGTHILTPSGERRIETLAVGDEVITADGETHIVRWVQFCSVSYLDQPDAPSPVLISANALGENRPKSDLIVSFQHRIAMGGFGQGEGIFRDLVLVPAASLTEMKGIRVMRGKRQVVWYHIALDTHELLLAEGCVAESLFFGPMFLQGLTRREALKLRHALPHRIERDRPRLPLFSVREAKREISGA